MTRSVGWIATTIAVGLGTTILGAAVSETTVQAQTLPQMRVTSDFAAPYALPPEEALPPPRIYGPRYGGPAYGGRPYDGPGYDEPRYAPAVLPPTAVYGILRQTGYSPLGIPQQRGFVYTISVISPDGDDGRLVIDARTGRILRFMPAYRLGDRMNDQVTVAYGPPAPPPVVDLRGLPRPPVPLPRVATRTPSVPLPKPMPRAVATPKVPAVVTAPAKPADAQASVAAPVPAAPPPVIEAKPATPTVQPTQDMPAAQGLE